MLSNVRLPDELDATEDEWLACDKYCKGCQYYGYMMCVGNCCNYALI